MKAILDAQFATLATAYPVKFAEGHLSNLDSGLDINATGYYWYGQEFLYGFFQFVDDIASDVFQRNLKSYYRLLDTQDYLIFFTK